MRLISRISAVSFLAMSVVAATGGAQAAVGPFDEFRFGGFDHDASIFGHQKETGVDLNGEVLFVSPDFLRVIGAPRPVVGVMANTHGQTSQGYFGLTWTWDFLQNVLTDGDGFYVEGTLGGAVHTGKLDVPGDSAEGEKRKSLGYPLLFREDADLGYHFNSVYSIAISYNHISDADLAKRNEGLNDIGLRFGIKF